MLKSYESYTSAPHWPHLSVEPYTQAVAITSPDVACRYEGSWVKGVREGQGKCKYANGDVYDGAWSADVRAGAGSCNYENGDKYTGAQPGEDTLGKGMHHMPWTQANFLESGPRQLERDQCTPQEARFTMRWCQVGPCPAERSPVRAGGWAGDKRQGHGTCRFADGSKFSGQWEADAWIQSLADAAKSKLGGAGLVKAAAGSTATFSIKVSAHVCR